MKKLRNRLYWLMVSVAAVGLAYGTYLNKTKPNARVDIVNLEDYSPRCANAQGEPVEFQARQHKVFADSGRTGLIFAENDKTILYDYDELSKKPPEYRDFILRAACARNAHAEAKVAECTAVKRLRDENSYSRGKVALIAEQINSDSVVSGSEKEKWTKILLACYDAPN